MLSRDIRRSYRQKLKTDEWHQFSAEVIERKDGKCFNCEATEHLQVHHLVYRDGYEPWDYMDEDLRVLCVDCHEAVHLVADLIWVEVLRFHPPELELILKRLKAVDDWRKRTTNGFNPVTHFNV